MPWSPDRPYNELPPLPPPVELEPRVVLKAAVDARVALSAMNQAAQLLPDPMVLVHAAALLEAQASSEIENVVTTADALFRYADAPDLPADHATKEALRYRTALFHGLSEIHARPLTAGTAAAVCSAIMDREMDLRRVPGTRIANPLTRRIIYAPPEGADVIRNKLADWEQFVHATTDLDPLVRMAVAHYQFEAIHPFHDGNGRTGRIVNILMLVEAGLIDQPVLYLSRYIIGHKNDYYRLLNAVTRDGDWLAWILYVLEAVRRTAESTLTKISAIRVAREDIRESARSVSTAGRNADFLAVLFEKPYYRISDVVTRCGVSRQTAAIWLRQLVDAELLTESKQGRERLFVNERFLSVLIRDELDPSD